MDRWKAKIQGLRDFPENRELYRMDGEPVVFEWEVVPGHTTLKLLHAMQQMMMEMNYSPEEFTDRIIFMSMYNDIAWEIDKNKIE